MRLKQGVNPFDMRPEIMLAVIAAGQVYADHGQELVITSITDGKHSDNSYHYKGAAIDTRTHYFDGLAEVNKVAQEIRSKLGSLYDVIVERDHLHIEFDIKRAI